jgi:hypothetical protein
MLLPETLGPGLRGVDRILLTFQAQTPGAKPGREVLST